MRVRDLPTKPLVAVEAHTSLAEVATRMRLNDNDSVAVVAQDRLLRIITERDIVRAIADCYISSKDSRRPNLSPNRDLCCGR
jgi:CBS domain-containing protein